MIETHCHLTDERLLNQLDAVLHRAASAGISHVLTIATDIEDAKQSIEIARQHDMVRAVIGVHPNYTANVSVADVDILRDLQRDPKVVALGEMGLDYFRDESPREQQKKLFEAQLQIAKDLNRPIVIHSREAITDTLEILKSWPTIRAVFHSFTGTPDEARKIVDAGYLIGFTGPVTYKKNDALREACKLVPLDRILVETDAPYLSPEPMRSQKINEPALVIHVAAMVAKVHGKMLPEIDEITSQTARTFFNL